MHGRIIYAGRIIDAYCPLFRALRLHHLCEEDAQRLAHRRRRGFMARNRRATQTNRAALAHSDQAPVATRICAAPGRRGRAPAAASRPEASAAYDLTLLRWRRRGGFLRKAVFKSLRLPTARPSPAPDQQGGAR
jgi:hypothetical protein